MKYRIVCPKCERIQIVERCSSLYGFFCLHAKGGCVDINKDAEISVATEKIDGKVIPL